MRPSPFVCLSPAQMLFSITFEIYNEHGPHLNVCCYECAMLSCFKREECLSPHLHYYPSLDQR